MSSQTVLCQMDYYTSCLFICLCMQRTMLDTPNLVPWCFIALFQSAISKLQMVGFLRRFIPFNWKKLKYIMCLKFFQLKSIMLSIVEIIIQEFLPINECYRKIFFSSAYDQKKLYSTCAPRATCGTATFNVRLESRRY